MTQQLDLLTSASYWTYDRWLALFRRIPYVLPHDTITERAGDVLLGYQCPVCTVVEPDVATLDREHGMDPHVPPDDSDDDEPWCRSIHRMRRIATVRIEDQRVGGRDR